MIHWILLACLPVTQSYFFGICSCMNVAFLHCICMPMFIFEIQFYLQKVVVHRSGLTPQEPGLCGCPSYILHSFARLRSQGGQA